MRKPRVLLADDHQRMLAALSRLLQPSYRVVGCISDGRLLLDAAMRLAPDVVVVDVLMSELNGLEACRRLKQQMPRTSVVVLTAANDHDAMVEAFRAGASAFVLKHVAADDLAHAIQEALLGRTFCSRAVREATPT